MALFTTSGQGLSDHTGFSIMLGRRTDELSPGICWWTASTLMRLKLLEDHQQGRASLPDGISSLIIQIVQTSNHDRELEAPLLAYVFTLPTFFQ
jgi:hypothetical protein